jgi:uncharacterized peroxidase-related enzyme
LLKDDALLARIDEDWRRAGLDPRRVAMLEYAEKLTSRPAEMNAKDVTALREAALEDVDILHLAECVAYYAYANRIADGLGVTLEATAEEDPR